MADDERNEDQNNESGKGDAQKTFTSSEVESLIKDQVEKATKALQKEYAGIQSGLQKQANEYKALLEQKENEGKTAEQKNEERLAKLEARAREAEARAQRESLKSFARGLLDESKIKPPKFFDRLIGQDEEETRKWVEDFITDEKERTAERNKEHDRANGRTVDGPDGRKPTAYENLLEMSDEELSRLSPLEIATITQGGKQE